MERRPHWTDDLIEAVAACLDTSEDTITFDMYAAIAAVEDWQKNHALMSPVGLLWEQQSAIQRVREVCADKYVGPPTEYGEGFQNGYNDALEQVSRALDGADDE